MFMPPVKNGSIKSFIFIGTAYAPTPGISFIRLMGWQSAQRRLERFHRIVRP